MGAGLPVAATQSVAAAPAVTTWLVGCVVMQANPGNVDTVIVAGRVMKRNGRLLHANLPRKLAELQASGDRIIADFAARH